MLHSLPLVGGDTTHYLSQQKPSEKYQDSSGNQYLLCDPKMPNPTLPRTEQLAQFGEGCAYFSRDCRKLFIITPILEARVSTLVFIT